MNNDVMARVFIDPNLGSYEQFFDHKWAIEVCTKTGNAPLNAPLESLILAWRFTNGSHRLPSLMMQILRSFADGDVNSKLRARACYVDSLVKGIVGKLEKRLPNLKPNQRVALHKAVAKIEKEEYEALNIARDQIAFDVEEFWEQIVHKDEFRFCLLGAQAANYGALFFAYEDFIANVVKTREPTFDSKNGSLKREFEKHFGQSLRDYCWPDDKAITADEIDLHRRVRNTLAHNGGRFADDLKKKFGTRFVDVTGTDRPFLRDDLFMYSSEKLQITPGNNAYLFRVLKDRVSRIVEEAV